jgi:hypothetical protein
MAAGSAVAESPDSGRLAGLVTGIRAAVLALPDSSRAAEDRLLLEGPISRLEALTGRDSRAAVAVVSRSRERDLAVDRGYPGAEPGLKADVRALLRWWHEEGGRGRVRDAASEEVFRGADEAVEQYNDALLDQAIGLVQRRLDRYEVKYGPGSPRLNFAEVGLNALLQSTGPLRPNHEGPSPNELLLEYSTSWGTVADDKAEAVSTFEIGWRRYDLNWRAGARSGWPALFRARYVAAGVAIAEGRDGALRWPLDGVAHRQSRVGPFLSLGDLKVAYLFGPERRLLVSRQIQLLPNLF